MKLERKEDKIDRIISFALHRVADNLEMHERVKWKIEGQIMGKGKTGGFRDNERM